MTPDDAGVIIFGVLMLVMLPAAVGALFVGVRWGVEIGTFAAAMWAAVFAAQARGGA